MITGRDVPIIDYTPPVPQPGKRAACKYLDTPRGRTINNHTKPVIARYQEFNN